MLGKVILFVTMAVLSLMSVFVTCAPLSEMKHITLHVQSEVLDGHKIVITLEPLDNTTKTLPVEFHDPFNVTIMSHAKSNDAGQLNEDLSNADTTTVGSDDLASTTPVTTELTSPEGTNGTNNETSPGDDKKVIVSQKLPKEPGVQGFLVTFPNIKCPEGWRPAPDGKCREIIIFNRSTAKSMNNVLLKYPGGRQNDKPSQEILEKSYNGINFVC